MPDLRKSVSSTITTELGLTFMSEPPASAGGMEGHHSTQQQMGQRKKSRMLVLDSDDHLAGVISLSDLVNRDEGRAAKTMGQVSSREARA